MKLLTTEIVTRMKQIGKLILFLVFLLSIHSSYSQCITIADLSYLFEGDFSSINESTYENNGQSEKLNFKGYNFSYQTDSYYFNNGDYLNLNSGDFLILTLSNSSCYSKIKASVAKESNSKVSSKETYSLNGLEIEKYRHLSKDLIIEFQKNTLEDKYFVVLMTSSVSDLMSSLIVQTIKRLEIEKRIADKISNVRKMISSNDLIKADLLLTEAVNYADLNNLNQEYDRELQQLKNEIVNIRFKAISKSFQEKMKLNKFLEANEILKGSKNIADNSISNQINQYQADLNSKAITFYTEKYKEKKELKNYTTAIRYLDSIVLFDPSNKMIKTEKDELVALNSFLIERNSSVYDYWELNPSIKNSLIKDYSSKCLSLVDDKSGKVSFDISIHTDTSCTLTANLSWRSAVDGRITFGEVEKNKFSLKPYQKFGYCGKSTGNLSFDLNWSSISYSNKIVDRTIKASSHENKLVSSYVLNNYPSVNGKFKYIESNVNLNGQQSNNLQLTGFHTRGPQNAIFSFILPGTGSLIVSYGKKGYFPLVLFGTGLAAVFISNDSSIVLAGVGSIATAYIWDFCSTLVIGSKNLARSKNLRKSLRNDPISL